MKRVFVAVSIALLGLSAIPAARAAADIATAGQGTGKATYAGLMGGSVTCTGPLAVTLNVRSNVAAITENWGPSDPAGADCSTMSASPMLFENQSPEVKECLAAPSLPVIGQTVNLNIGINLPYTLSQSSNVYTLKGSAKSCDGTLTTTDTLSVTVKATQLIYSHVLISGTTTVLKVSGTLTKVA